MKLLVSSFSFSLFSKKYSPLEISSSFSNSLKLFFSLVCVHNFYSREDYSIKSYDLEI